MYVTSISNINKDYLFKFIGSKKNCLYLKPKIEYKKNSVSIERREHPFYGFLDRN
jgi:hypothetical protein